MFASLSSFLPSALQPVAQAPRPLPEPRPPSPTVPPDAPAVAPPRRKEKKEKQANEAFIIVRPPPSKSAQPLSLQLQLIPPQSRNDRPLQALDSSPDDLGTDLQRTHSNGSEASAASGCTSAGSVSSFSSSSTSSSGRRTIIPLYNLNVHSVMPTTILDAGTDAKVAKFVKRGLEVVGLAFLEPIEVRPPSVPAHGYIAQPVNVRVSLDDPLREFGSVPSRSASPTRPHTSHATVHSPDRPKPTVNLIIAPPLPPPDQQPPQRSTKNFLSRVFKKKDPVTPISIAVPLPDDISPHPSPRYNSTPRSNDVPISHSDTLLLDAWPSTPLAGSTASSAAVLGVHSTLYPPVSNPKGRPTKYIWIVRKWLKGVDTGILNGVMGKINSGARDTLPDSPYAHVEVRFEWSREQKKGSVRKSRGNKSSKDARESLSPVRHGALNITEPRFTSHTLAPGARDHRSSVISHNSSGSDTAASLVSNGAHRNAGESDEESDPEDSETPWTCAVAVQRLGQSLQRYQREPAIRLKVASLAPTPHHPKVVGLLKIPFPLPDIEVERLAVRRRHVTALGISKTTSSQAGELTLTAEEIKDTVSSTALWLVVREAFGGVGRERKKVKS